MIGGEHRHDHIRLGGYPFRLIGAMQGPSLLTPLAEKVTIGEHTRVDDVLLSSWVVSNLRGGLGVARIDAATQTDRYRYGTAWVLQDQEILLPTLPAEITAGVPAGTEARTATTYANHLYMAFNEKVRLFSDSTQTFLTPVEAGYADLVGNATDMFVIRLANKDWLCIADANGLLTFDGTTWAYQTGNGTTIPLAQWLEEFDHKLYALDVNNNLWSTVDLTTWVEHAAIPVQLGDVLGLDLFFDAGEAPKLHAPTVNGLWLYDNDGDVWVRTRLRFPRHRDGGKGHVPWRDEYFLSAGMDVYHFTGGNVISPSSLNRDDGLPRDYQGAIVALEALPSHLAAAVSGGLTVTGAVHYPNDAHNFDASRAPDLAARSAIYFWTGSAWQPFWLSPVNGSVMHFLHYSDADGTYRLWWGANDRVYYAEFAAAIFQPRLAPTWPFAPSAFFETGRFDGAWQEEPKLAVRTKVRLKHASATELVRIFYRIDQSDPWISLGTVAADGLTTIPMETNAAEADGLLFYDYEYRVEIERGSDSSLSPTLVFVKLEYIRRQDARFGFRFQIVTDEAVDGVPPEEQVRRLQVLAAEKLLVDFEYRPSDRTPVTGKVLVSQITAITMPGLDTSARYQCSVLVP